MSYSNENNDYIYKTGTIDNIMSNMYFNWRKQQKNTGDFDRKCVFLIGERHLNIKEFELYEKSKLHDNNFKNFCPDMCTYIGILNTILNLIDNNIINSKNPTEKLFKIYLEENNDNAMGLNSLYIKHPLNLTNHLLNHKIIKRTEKIIFSTIKPEQRRDGIPEIPKIKYNESIEDYHTRFNTYKNNSLKKTGNNYYVNEILNIYNEENTKVIIAKMGLHHISEMKVILEKKNVNVVCINSTKVDYLMESLYKLNNYNDENIKIYFGNLSRKKFIDLYKNDIWNIVINEKDNELDKKQMIKLGSKLIKEIEILQKKTNIIRIGPKLPPEMLKESKDDFFYN